MGVSRTFSEKLVFDFNETANEIVSKYNLDHMVGTTALEPIEIIGQGFETFVGANKAKPNVTEGILEAESRLHLAKLESVAMKISKGEKQDFIALQGKARRHTASEDIYWRPVVRYAADEIDHLTKKYEPFFKADDLRTKGIDAKFARLLKYIQAEHQSDPSKENADTTLYSVRRSLKRIEGYIQVEQDRTKRIAQKRAKDKLAKSSIPSNPVKAYSSGMTNGSDISGVFGSSSRPPIRGIGNGNPTAPVAMYDTIQPGVFNRFFKTVGSGVGIALAALLVVKIASRKPKNKNTQQA